MSNYHSASTGGIIIIVFSSFSNMKVGCVFLLESSHRGDSIEYVLNMKKKISLNILS